MMMRLKHHLILVICHVILVKHHVTLVKHHVTMIKHLSCAIVSLLTRTSPLIGTTPVKCKLCNMCDSTSLGKKTCTTITKDCVVTGFDMPVVRTEWPEYRYYPVNEEWQHNACTQVGLTFVRPFTHVSGGPDVVLRRPVTTSLKKIGGDGNCLFRSLCYIITGSQAQHYELRSAIVAHMLSIPHLLCGLGVMVIEITFMVSMTM